MPPNRPEEERFGARMGAAGGGVGRGVLGTGEERRGFETPCQVP